MNINQTQTVEKLQELIDEMKITITENVSLDPDFESVSEYIEQLEQELDFLISE